jgi:hypothetical protein
VWKKETLDGIIDDLEKWQRRFDPSWFLRMKIASPVIDEELTRAKKDQSSVTAPVPGGTRRLRGSAASVKFPLTAARGLRDVVSLQPQQQFAIFLPSAQIETIDIPFSCAKAGRHKLDDKK